VAYERFLLDARELVRVFLQERVRSSSWLEDVVQETLISIHRSRHSYDPSRPIGPWIRAIALNRLRDWGRARKRREQRASADLDWHNALHPVAMTDTPPLTPLRGALGFLSEAQREVIWLLKIEGYSVAETASETGRSAAAVKVMAHRGYRALRAILGVR
jgi:RNA polymerase sigma-70 factor (ECF subfamily)